MKRFGVVGSGIGYTKSPLIHNAIYHALGIDAQYSVEDLPPGALAENISRLMEKYDGFNVTQPFKREILKYVTSDRAAVNTVITSSRKGYNTDGEGFMTDLSDFTGNVNGMPSLILGAGGAAETVAEELVRAGAKVMIYNRTRENATMLAQRTGASADIDVPPELIVNCTPIGWDRETNPLPPSVSMSELKYAYDLIYPPWITPFLANARLVGAETRSGLGMLVHQAIRADEIFLGRTLDKKLLCAVVMKKIAEENAV